MKPTFVLASVLFILAAFMSGALRSQPLPVELAGPPIVEGKMKPGDPPPVQSPVQPEFIPGEVWHWADIHRSVKVPLGVNVPGVIEQLRRTPDRRGWEFLLNKYELRGWHILVTSIKERDGALEFNVDVKPSLMDEGHPLLINGESKEVYRLLPSGLLQKTKRSDPDVRFLAW